MKACIVYSSCTGNTRKVAEALAETSGIACFAVRHAPNPDDYDLLALGFWVRKGLPDARAQRYMARVSGRSGFSFLARWARGRSQNTPAAAWRPPTSCYKLTAIWWWMAFVSGQGKPAGHSRNTTQGGHPMTAERRARQIEAERHPDAADLAAARLHWQRCLQKCAAVTPSMQSDPLCHRHFAHAGTYRQQFTRCNQPAHSIRSCQCANRTVNASTRPF